MAKRKITHKSDCATNNGPALPPGPCDCGAEAARVPTLTWPDNIGPAEFENPNYLDPMLVSALGVARAALGRPFYFTHTKTGRHPSGDAVEPDSPTHAPFSYHRWGVNHDASVTAGELVASTSALCRAVDFDMGCVSGADFFDCWQKLEMAYPWGGLGLYPWWRNELGQWCPGFHVDIRSTDKIRWLRGEAGAYVYNPGWSELKGEILGLEQRMLVQRRQVA